MSGRRAHRSAREERGGVAVIVAVLIVPFVMLVAFAADLGMAYAQAQAFASGADSAALAIVDTKREQLNKAPTTPMTCAQVVANDAGQASTIATKQANANGPFGLRTTDGIQVQVTLSCVNSAGAPDPTGNLRAAVTVRRDVPTTIGRIMGVTTMNATKQGTAALGVEGAVASAFPLTICDDQARAIMASATSAPYPAVLVDVDKVWKNDCDNKKNGSGNWGWLNCGGNGIPTLVDAVENGCDIDLTLTGSPPTIDVDGTPGNKINSGPLGNALDGAKGKVYPFPVYTKVTGNGAGTTYKVVGFINLQFVDWDKNGNITVRYVSYSPVGSLNPTCGLGKTGCTAFNAFTTRLSS